MKRILVLAVVVACLTTLVAPATLGAAAPSSGSKVIALGTAVHQGKLVQGFAFVHGRARPGGSGKPGKADPLYAVMAKGAKWKSTEAFVLNGTNADAVSPSAALAAMNAGVSAWEAQVTTNVFGDGALTNDALAADYAAPDGVNEAYFSAAELDQGTVAMTVVWGVFGGPPQGRELIEWDMIFNDALSEDWGDATAQQGLWDVANIATHELGHSAGLADLYTTAAAEQTMYGYASPGETKKRTLESGDIAGIKSLYP